MSRTILVNRYFHPDSSATSQLASDLAMSIAARGHQVLAITGGQQYNDPHAQLPREEVCNTVRIVRVAATRFGRGNLAGRCLDYVSFYFGALFALLREVAQGDVVIAMTDPPLLGLVATFATSLRRAHCVHWMQDVFPEVAERVGVIRARALLLPLRHLRNRSLKSASCVVAIGQRMAKYLEPHCARPPVIIPNWALEELAGASPGPNPLRSEWGIDEYFVVGYSGNMGRAHLLSELIDAAINLIDVNSFRLLMVGDGKQRAAMVDRVEHSHAGNVVFKPYQPRERLRTLLMAPNIHVVSLDPALEGLIVPSKFVGVIALGMPVLFVGDADGEVGTQIREYGCGVVVPAGDVAALAGALRELAADYASGGVRLKQMAARALALWRDRLQRKSAIDEWLQLLSRVRHAAR